MIHLDTNSIITVLNERSPVVRDKLDNAVRQRSAISISSIVYHELMFGAAASHNRARNEDRILILLASSRIQILPLTTEDAAEAADIRAHLKRLGTPIGPYDLLIAAQARRAGVLLVTANTREFQRVPGLSVADWSLSA